MTHFLFFSSLQNVLEGIGLLNKQGKNHVSWNDNPQPAVTDAKDKSDSDSEAIGSPPRITKTTAVSNGAEFEELKKKLDRLKDEERTVDRYLDYLKEQASVYNGQQPPTREQLEALPAGVSDISENMYVRFKDITEMPEFKSETVIGIRAPTGTSLEVPDPDQGMKPGQRRFEMYLSSKGTQGGKGGNGEPINVYLVQPRAEQQNKAGRGHQEGSGQNDNIAPQLGQPEDPSTHGKGSGPAVPSNEPSEPPPPGFGRGQSRQGDPAYGMPPPQRGGDWNYGPMRPPYPTQERIYRPDGSAPTPNNPTSGRYHPEKGWGAPLPHGGYGPPPPGYYSSRLPPRPTSTDLKKTPSTERHYREERSREEGIYPPSRYPPHAEAGHPHNDRGNPFRPRSHHYQTTHELGRTASSGGDHHRESQGAFRPPSPPTQQQTLLNMPLQSPSEGHYFPSPSAGPGFSPPGGLRTDVRTDDVTFPMPAMPHDSREYRGQRSNVRPRR